MLQVYELCNFINQKPDYKEGKGNDMNSFLNLRLSRYFIQVTQLQAENLNKKT